MTEAHVELPPITLIKGTCDGKSYKFFVKLKLRRHPTYSKSDLYYFRMSLSDNGEPDQFMLSVHNFNMTLEASGMIYMGAKIQYLLKLLRGEA